MKTEAYQVMKRIREGDHNFTSKYTSAVSEDSYGIMKVNDELLFNDLTDEEKLELAEEDQGVSILGLWTNSYIYVLNTWVLISKLNTWDVNFSYSPAFIRVGSDHILLTEDYTLYKQVDKSPLIKVDTPQSKEEEEEELSIK